MSWVKLYGGCTRTIQQYTPRQPLTTSACPSLFKQTLTDLLALTNITKTSIAKYFPPSRAYAPSIASMSYSISVSPMVFIYMRYMELYPNTKISFSDIISLNNLKDLYLQYNLSPQDDPTLANAIAKGII